MELVEDDEQEADGEDAELHRQLHEAVEHEPEARLRQRRAGQVALHLRLVGAEVGELHEEAAGQAAPDCVARVEARREVDDLHLAERATDGERVVERDRGRQAVQDEGERRGHAAEHHHHLPGLRAADHARAARDRVEDDGAADGEGGPAERPAEHRRQHDRRRVERDAGAEPAREQKQQRNQLPRLAIEARFQIFVRGVDLEPVVDGHDHRREDDHGDRQAEVELDEAHAVLVGLAGHRQERDGAGLRGHDREADGPPAQVAAAAQVGLGALDLARLPGAVDDDERRSCRRARSSRASSCGARHR